MTQTIQKHASVLSRSPEVRYTARYIEEAPLYFRSGTQDIDQKRGLSINGPADAKTDVLYTIRVGIVSTGGGIQELTSFLEYMNNNVIPSSGRKPFSTQSFPGFIKAFRCQLVMAPITTKKSPQKKQNYSLTSAIPKQESKEQPKHTLKKSE